MSDVPNSALSCYLDEPVAGAHVRRTPFLIRGWVVDAQPVSRVEIWINGARVGLAGMGRPRPDVATALERPDAELCGFEYWFAPSEVADDVGTFLIAARAVLLDGSVVEAGDSTVQIPSAFADDGISVPEADPIAPRRQSPTPSPRHRVRLFCWARSLDLGGSQLRLRELVSHLCGTARFDITVLSPVDGPVRDDLDSAGVRVQIIGAVPLHDPSAYQSWLETMTERVRDQCDVILAATLSSFFAIEIANRLGIPSVWRVGEREPLHTVCHWLGEPLHPALGSRGRQALILASTVVFTSRESLAAHTRGGVAGEFMVLPSGVDMNAVDEYVAGHPRAASRAWTGIPLDRRLMVCAGSLWPIKGQHMVTGALAELHVRHPELVAVMMGKDADQFYGQAVRRSAAAHGVRDNARVMQFVNDMRPWWHAADVALCPSESESLPTAILEAMAFGHPVLAAGTGGVDEVVEDGVTGWLFEPSDLGSCIAAMERMASTPGATLAEMGAHAQNTVKIGYDSAGAVRRMTELLTALSLGNGSSQHRVRTDSRR